jgi:di/tricarboxylate transporter
VIGAALAAVISGCLNSDQAYKFGDFIKIGVPLLILTWIATLLVAPLVFPFY